VRPWSRSSTSRLALGLGVTLLSWAAGCLPPKDRPAVEEKLPPHVSMYGVRLRSWEGSELVAQGRAARLTYDRQTSRFVASEGQLQFPRRDTGAAERSAREATADLEVRAPVVQGDLATRQAEGAGGVTVRSSSGLIGQTPAAQFDGLTGVARSTTPVQAEGPGYALTAGGFTFQFATDTLVFDGPVTSFLGEAQE
jgi:hypothetical protein